MHFHGQHDTQAGAPKGARHWRQFSVRALLIIISVAGVAFGWAHLTWRQSEAIAGLQKSNPAASVYFDYQIDAHGELMRANERSGFDWLHSPRRVDYFSSAARVDMAYATDADLAWVARLPALRRLTLERCIDVTDAGLASLSRLRHLKALTIHDGFQITDQGLRSLQTLSSLELLTLVGTRINRAAIEEFQRALRDCRVETGDQESTSGDLVEGPASGVSPLEAEFFAG